MNRRGKEKSSVWDIPVSKEEINILRMFVSLVTLDMPVAEVCVFGSKARGDYTDDSDTDVLVLVRGEERTCKLDNKIREISSYVNIYMDGQLNVLCENYEDWYKEENINVLLKRNIDNDGISIYG